MIIGQTNIGSHMWNMEHSESDIDIFEIYMEDTRKILLGQEPKSYCNQTEEKDISGHEIGKVVNMILKGNINFIWGVFSPIVYADTIHFKELRDLSNMNHSKQIYYSINGMAIHNLKRLKEEGLTEKKAKTIARTIQFGIDYLNGGGIKYTNFNYKQFPTDYKSIIDYLEMQLDELNEAKSQSKLPEEPENKALLNEWLINKRIEYYDNMKYKLGD